MLKILSAKNAIDLEKEAEKYNITGVGSLTISNGHFFLAILGEPKTSGSTETTSKRRVRTTKKSS